jgi:long-chain acyl-CoA synthetase
VFGVLDDRLGEEVGAAVVVREGLELAADSLRGHCASLISAHKIPRYIWFLESELPRNASGKFVKGELRDTLNLADAV